MTKKQLIEIILVLTQASYKSLIIYTEEAEIEPNCTGTLRLLIERALKHCVNHALNHVS